MYSGNTKLFELFQSAVSNTPHPNVLLNGCTALSDWSVVEMKELPWFEALLEY